MTGRDGMEKAMRIGVADGVTAEQRRKAALALAATAISCGCEGDLGEVLAHLGLLPDQNDEWS